jgi:1,4-dihydroxy-2-naphthoate polyprenyltransferase
MDPSLIAAPHTRAVGTRAPLRRLLRVIAMVRYRFFLYAGLLPYLLGAAWAYAVAGSFDVAIFWSGLGGVVLAVIGVEAFNEYFDARMGTDRVFNPKDLPPISDAVFWLGVAAFAGALAVGIYLTARGGWPIFLFALLGGTAAIFY